MNVPVATQDMRDTPRRDKGIGQEKSNSTGTEGTFTIFITGYFPKFVQDVLLQMQEKIRIPETRQRWPIRITADC